METISKRELIERLAREERDIRKSGDQDKVVKDRIRKRIKYAVEVKRRLEVLSGLEPSFDYESAEKWAATEYGEIGRRAFGKFKRVIAKMTGNDSRPAGMAELKELLLELPKGTSPYLVGDLKSLFARALAERDRLRTRLRELEMTETSQRKSR